MKRALLFLLSSCVLLGLLGCSSTAFTPTPTPTSPTQIAFLQAPTPTPSAVENGPALTAPSGTIKIMVMNADGTGQTQVGETGQYAAIDISHDGSKVVVTAYDSELGMQLLVGSMTTQTATDITPEGTGPEMPEFSPDGTKVYFINTEPSPYEIWSVDINGDNAKSLGDGGITCMHEMTVANGKIYFYGHLYEGKTYGIYVMNADGSSAPELLIAGSAHHPSLTADGTKLVFEDSTDGQYIAAAALDGKAVALTTTGQDEDPIVVGDQILFISNRDGNREVYSMNLDGTGQTRLTTNSANDWFGEYYD